MLPALVLPLAGWSNNGNSNGFRTHDWIVERAWRVLGRPKWFKSKIARSASDDPDTQLKDYDNHNYDIWGARRGHGDKKVKEVFNQAVAAYKTGDYHETSRLIGLMSHYYADLNSPLHTDDLPGEKRMRRHYERWVDIRMVVNRLIKGSSPWPIVTFDGRHFIKKPGRLARRAAKAAHEDYDLLVSEYNGDGFDSTVTAITERNLNRAVNGLADLIYSVQRTARTQMDHSSNIRR